MERGVVEMVRPLGRLEGMELVADGCEDGRLCRGWTRIGVGKGDTEFKIPSAHAHYNKLDVRTSL